MIEQTWLQMGMPVTVCISEEAATDADVATVVTCFEAINQRFSPYLETSEVCRFNNGTLDLDELSDEFSLIVELCEQTKRETDGYFDAIRDGQFDPSGLVKGWAIEQASNVLLDRGFENFVVDVGGDIRAFGVNRDRRPWQVGIRNPFRRDEVVKVLAISNRGVATSGTAIRGSHIYNPHQTYSLKTDLVSLTVVAPTVYDADRIATAAFAMGDQGLAFIAAQPGLDGYAIGSDGIASYTQGFGRYVQ
jgi:thiamine biosynthesis lipoprotein